MQQATRQLGITAVTADDGAVVAASIQQRDHAAADQIGVARTRETIADEFQRLVDPRAMDAATALANGAVAHTVAHAGHAPFLGASDAVVQALDEFMQGLPE